MNADNEYCGGGPSNTVNKMIHCFCAPLLEDRHFMITDMQHEIARQFLHKRAHSTIHTVLTKQLEMCKACAQ